jgi:hypothetical protein
MTQGAGGSWLLLDKFTTEPQKPTPIYLFYLGLGHLSKIFNASVQTTFFISRYIFGSLLMLIAIFAIRYLLDDERQRKISYLLVLLGSGLTWLFGTVGQRNIDQFIPDAIPLVRFSHFPHIMLATALLFVSLLSIFRYSQSPKIRWVAVGGISCALLNIVLPFYSFVVYLVAFLFLLIITWQKKLSGKNLLQGLATFGIISLPTFIFMAYIGTINPIWKMVEAQNILRSPSIIAILIGYGLAGGYAIGGISIMFYRRKPQNILILVWLGVSLVLTYAPIPMQRRAIESGLYLPLALAASLALAATYQYFDKTKYGRLKQVLIIMITLLLAIGGNYSNLIRSIGFTQRFNDLRFYQPKDNIDALNWIKNNTPLDSIIMANFNTSNIIPTYAERTVYAGHGPMTIDLNEYKFKNQELFFSNQSSSKNKYNFLKKEKINYIFYSQEEKNSGTFNPQKYPFLKSVYRNNQVDIYQFNDTPVAQ